MPYEFNQRIVRTGDPYLYEDTDLRGGYRSVATITERNNIPLGARKLGMVVYVQADKTEYWLVQNIINSSWQVKPSGATVSTTLLHFFDNVHDYVESDFETIPIEALASYLTNGVQASGAMYRIKIYQAVDQQGTIIHNPPPGNYVGEITVMYTDVPLLLPVYPAQFFLVSKYLVPQPSTVAESITEYSERMEALNG